MIHIYVHMLRQISDFTLTISNIQLNQNIMFPLLSSFLVKYIVQVSDTPFTEFKNSLDILYHEEKSVILNRQTNGTWITNNIVVDLLDTSIKGGWEYNENNLDWQGKYYLVLIYVPLSSDFYIGSSNDFLITFDYQLTGSHETTCSRTETGT